MPFRSTPPDLHALVLHALVTALSPTEQSLLASLASLQNAYIEAALVSCPTLTLLLLEHQALAYTPGYAPSLTVWGRALVNHLARTVSFTCTVPSAASLRTYFSQ